MNPATQEQIGTVALGSEDDLDLAVAAANAAFERFSTTSKADRMDLLNSLMDVSRRRLEDLAQAMSAGMGAPPRHPDDVLHRLDPRRNLGNEGIR